MNNQVNKNDIQAVAGGALGVESISSQEDIIVFTPKETLSSLGNKAYNAVSRRLSSTTDEYRSAKYPVSAEGSYYANGAISIFEKAGKFVFSKTVNNNNRGALRLDQTNSTLYSSSDKTTLGSTKIETVDGWLVNPASLSIPSTNYSPSTPWIKKIFPSVTEEQLLTFGILTIIQAVLADPIAEEPKDYRITKNRKDLGAIIVDNQEIEDRLFKISRGT